MTRSTETPDLTSHEQKISYTSMYNMANRKPTNNAIGKPQRMPAKQIVQHNGGLDDAVYFDSVGGVAQSNGKVCVVSSRGLSTSYLDGKDFCSWSITLKKSNVKLQEVGIVGTNDIENIAVASRGVRFTNELGARCVFGSKLRTGAVYYDAISEHGLREYRDLSKDHVRGWCANEVITVAVDLKEWRCHFILRGPSRLEVHKSVPMQKNKVYYPFISFAGDCKYDVSDVTVGKISQYQNPKPSDPDPSNDELKTSSSDASTNNDTAKPAAGPMDNMVKPESPLTEFPAQYVKHRGRATDAVYFDSVGVTQSNGKVCVVSSRGLRPADRNGDDSYSWSIRILSSGVELQEIGIVGTNEIGNIAMSDRGARFTNELGARCVYGCEMGTRAVYYYATSEDGKSRYQDLSKEYRRLWCEGDVITVAVNLKTWRCSFLLNGTTVRKSVPIQNNKVYYPFISFAGDCRDCRYCCWLSDVTVAKIPKNQN